MKIGVIYPQKELKGDPQAVRAIGLATEERGFDHLLAYDHVIGASHDREPKLTGPYTEKDPFHDPLVMFAYIAALTKRIELVTGILILPQRQTALVARQAADLDLLSGERFRMGVGVGWNYVEYDVLGQDFASRGKRMAEQIDLMRRLWTEDLVDFSGEFDRADRIAALPRPRRSVPVWMGGFADVALRRAARIADGFIFADGAGNAFDQLGSLDAYLAENGRSGEAFGKQINMLRPKSAAEVAETVQRWRDAGGTHAAINSMGMGFTTAAEHIAYFASVADACERAGLSLAG
ncbi:LLM class F420-dependent oxidoreductase [Novosphingobium sp. G106]|uniref:LLM class F420-dependent oxidoreductase n=1 Tax=Novosphingobium sp. G106 TaxID=2849500 RepID=UPI001C2D58A9|nr:LLM class F420-dependent oxidoreductase [Novosphingobium sp. G106]MBV1691106.1 LLM class F420-dependent oxidoreductase [Novosphingobium sp. G106]